MRAFRRRADSASRSASLVVVLPTEPVTAMTLPCRRSRAARASARKPSSTSSTTSSGASAEPPALTFRHHGQTGAGLQRGVDEVVTVAIVALDREECVALAQRAAVDGDAGNRRRANVPARSACIASDIASS